MTTVLTILAAASLFTGLSAVAHAQDPHAGHGAEQGGTTSNMQGHAVQMMMPSEEDAPSTRAFKEGHMKMMHDMRMTYTGKPDVDFARGMIPHHRGAIEMARVQLEHGTDPEMRALAETIIAEQEKEIAQLETWIAANEAD